MNKYFKAKAMILSIEHNEKVFNFNYISIAIKQLIAHICYFKTETLLHLQVRYFDRKRFSRL